MEKDDTKQDVDLENNETVTTEETEKTEEPKEDYRAKLNAQNRFLEKEGYTFENGKWVKPQSETKPIQKKEEPGLSTTDLYTLMKANVPEEDVSDVQEFAKFKGISVSEALKSPIMKSILAEKTENRRTAEATQTRNTRQTTKADGASILDKARAKGEEAIPEPGSEDAEAVFWARRGKK